MLSYASKVPVLQVAGLNGGEKKDYTTQTATNVADIGLGQQGSHLISSHLPTPKCVHLYVSTSLV